MRRATARRENGSYKHTVSVRSHEVTVDEPEESGGEDSGPDPQEMLAISLASCTAITMEMYAKRKGWNIGDIEVEVDYEPAQRGSPTPVGTATARPASGPPATSTPGRRASSTVFSTP